jgi:2-keto-4-pentenoate hydratase
MTTARIEQVARALLGARHEQAPRDASIFADALGGVADAYAVQDLVARCIVTQQQGLPRYWKSGGSGLGAEVPHAALPPDGVWTSPADARSWPLNLFLVEAEIALRLGREVTPSQALAIHDEEAYGLADAMAVAIELVDSRWRQGLSAPALLKLADLQSHGALVLAGWIPFVARDWAAQPFSVHIGGRPAFARAGGHSLDDPARVLPAWLRHATREGLTVPAGTAVTTGSWCGMLPVAAGDLVVVRFEGVGEASVQF